MEQPSPSVPQTWFERKKRIIKKYNYLRAEDLLLIEYNSSEFINRLQAITGLPKADLISQIENI